MNTWQNIYIKFKIVARITCAMYRREGNQWEGICPGLKNDRREYVQEAICPYPYFYLCICHGLLKLHKNNLSGLLSYELAYTHLYDL